MAPRALDRNTAVGDSLSPVSNEQVQALLLNPESHSGRNGGSLESTSRIPLDQFIGNEKAQGKWSSQLSRGASLDGHDEARSGGSNATESGADTRDHDERSEAVVSSPVGNFSWMLPAAGFNEKSPSIDGPGYAVDSTEFDSPLVMDSGGSGQGDASPSHEPIQPDQSTGLENTGSFEIDASRSNQFPFGLATAGSVASPVVAPRLGEFDSGMGFSPETRTGAMSGAPGDSSGELSGLIRLLQQLLDEMKQERRDYLPSGSREVYPAR